MFGARAGRAPLVPPGRGRARGPRGRRRLTCGSLGAPGRIRTCDTRFRKPMLYPLSYEGRRGLSTSRGRRGSLARRPARVRPGYAGGMGHGHNHGAGTGTARRRRLAIVLGLSSVVLVVEIIGAIVTDSLALLADAGHMLTDVGCLALALWATVLVDRPVSARRTFGLKRAEVLAAAAQAAVLL